MFDSSILNITMSSASLVISLILMIIHIKSRRTQLNTYFLSRATHRSSSIVFDYISSETSSGSMLITLSLYNPGSVAAIIRCLTIYEERQSKFFLVRSLGLNRWMPVNDAIWWPTSDPRCKEEKYLADEYRSLYVRDQRDIYVKIPRITNGIRYRFELRTNHGGVITQATTGAGKSHFPHAFSQWFSDD